MEQHLYLAHHGIKGQKWGVRRFQNDDGTLTEAGKDRYSKEQFKRDAAIYGRGGARRIRKDVEKRGISVSGARSKESDRINAARSRAKVAGQVGSTAGALAGLAAGSAATYLVGKGLRDRNAGVWETLSTTQGSLYIGLGLTSVGKTLGREGGRAVAMLGSGYSPAKYRSV